MKKLLLLIPALIVTGCCSTTFTQQSVTKDGVTNTTSIHVTRNAWHADSYIWQFNTNGTWSASANNSGPDAATIAAATAMVQTVGAVVNKTP